MADSYVCSGARIKCSCGDKISTLTVFPNRTVFLTEKPMANISDHISINNIAPFGKCHTVSYPPTGSATSANHGCLTPMPCVPGTISEWINGKGDYIIKGKPALLKSSYCHCKWGGIITITVDGQTDTGKADLSQETVETEEQWKLEQEEQLTSEEILDGIQLALDAAGFVPGFGAIPDLFNVAISALRGDWTNAGLSLIAAVPGIGDAAAAVKLANKGVKAAKVARATGKTVKATEKTADNVVSMAERRAAKTEKLINESDNVIRMPSRTIQTPQSTSTVAKVKSENVIQIKKYEPKVEKQVNGPDKVTVVKKTDTVVDSIGEVKPVTSSKQTGSSTSYRGESESGGSRNSTDYVTQEWQEKTGSKKKNRSEQESSEGTFKYKGNQSKPEGTNLDLTS